MPFNDAAERTLRREEGMPIQEPDVEVLLPIHNEAATIEHTIREIYDELSPHVSVRFIAAEDGSTDGTKEILRKLSKSYPMKLEMGDERRGYGLGVLAGLRLLEAPYLLALDSDGQCDPKDFWKYWAARDKYDVITARRVDRKDTVWRRLASRTFYWFYQAVFRLPVHDPSLCYILARRDVVKRLVGEIRGKVMVEGFWWEFNARAHRRGYRLGEIPVNHRDRLEGESRLFPTAKWPSILCRHALGVLRVWYQTRA